MDITSYLVLHTSYYTASQMKAYKSLEAFNYFVCGWVNDLGTKEALNKCRLVFARKPKCALEELFSEEYRELRMTTQKNTLSLTLNEHVDQEVELYKHLLPIPMAEDPVMWCVD
ncbi:hypothetical protein F7725_007538 [Dissostichus mawsoni]|uniref:Uncharacterized protein n=1 Tax=Dissostichus mawsoni TaxID=36200 RepID=A0A7J5Y4P1_DISMA|nr:hypothetical protein F7725_007538 [Dissostichus mawsoni]